MLGSSLKFCSCHIPSAKSLQDLDSQRFKRNTGDNVLPEIASSLRISGCQAQDSLQWFLQAFLSFF